MFDMLTMDLLFTIAASSALVGLWVATTAVLPWTDAELEEVDGDLRRIADSFRPEPEVVAARR
ncbi:MAG TPA: hypothetical protein QGF58_23305 [Myxococcota bacterium]|nr:hypothetical protein [Myxococcota bacterium]